MRGIEQTPWAYDMLMVLPDWAGLLRWRRWLAGGASGRTLEVGCGTGRNLPLYPESVQVVGLDPCWDNLHRARRRAPHVSFVCASAEALPFKGSGFDTVVASLVFCSVPEPAQGLAEVRRVLSGRGTLRMLEHVRSTKPVGARLQELLQPFWTWATGGCHPNRDTEHNVEAAGFHIEAEGGRTRGIMRRFQARQR